MTEIFGDAALDAASSLTATASLEVLADATLDAASSLTTAGVLEVYADAALVASAVLTTDGVREVLADATLLSATSSLTAEGVVARLGGAVLDAGSTLTAAALVFAEMVLSQVGAPFVVDMQVSYYVPPPVPPVAASPLADPTVAPTLTHGAGGELLAGTYDYVYDAWQSSRINRTAPSPLASISFAEAGRAVAVVVPAVTNADGFTIYRRRTSAPVTPWIYVGEVGA